MFYMASIEIVKGRRVSIDLDGTIIIDGNTIPISKGVIFKNTYLDGSDTEIKELTGKSLEDLINYCIEQKILN